jgi:hypothetical protein
MPHNHNFDTNSWPFDCPIETDIVTTKFVYEVSAPIVQVLRYLDGGWQFMCNTTEDPNDGLVLCLGCLYEKHPEIIKFSKLQLGYEMYQAGLFKKWKTERFE